MENRSKPESSQTRFASPVVSFLYNYAEVSAHGDKGKLSKEASKLSALEESRKKFVAFSKKEGLGDITTVQDFMGTQFAKLSKLLPLSPEQVFTYLKEYREQDRTAEALIGYGNIYISVKALETEKSKVEALKDIDPLQDFQQWNRIESDTIAAQKLPETINKSTSMFEITPTTLSPSQKEAAAFASHKESVLARYMFSALGDSLAGKIGRDVITGKPVIFNEKVEKFEDAQRFSRPLPERLENWKERKLTQKSIPDDAHLVFVNDVDNLCSIASVILPNSTYFPAFEQLQTTKRGMFEMGRKWGENEESKEFRNRYFGYEQQLRRQELDVRQKMFAETVACFNEATEVVHPDIEKSSRTTAVYAISIGEGANFFDGYKIVEEHEGKPLAHSVQALKQLAYREGVYLDPLKNKMAEEIKNQKLNPTEVANHLQQVFDDKQNRSPILSPASEAEENWFVREAFYAVSTVDSNGEYTVDVPEQKKERYLTGKARRPEVIEDLIKYVRGLGV